eukprot:4610802-Amphidinium_carterae.1
MRCLTRACARAALGPCDVVQKRNPHHCSHKNKAGCGHILIADDEWDEPFALARSMQWTAFVFTMSLMTQTTWNSKNRP